MKILFLGDYSNMHGCLASRLRSEGHQCTVVSDGGTYMRTPADVLLRRGDGFGGSVKYLYDIFSGMADWKGYDIVQLNNPHFFRLRPGKLRYIFNTLLSNNGRVCMTLASNDYFFVRDCCEGKMFRFSEFRVGNEPTDYIRSRPTMQEGYLRSDVKYFTEYVYSRLYAGMSLLPEYDMSARPVLGQRCRFTNLPVDLSVLDWHEPDLSGPINIFIGLSPGREMQKGTDKLLLTALRLEEDLPGRVKVIQARGMALNDYLRAMGKAHIVLDQLYSYSPATNALQAMAMGAVPVSGAQPEYYEMLSEERRPIIEASPLRTDLYDRLKELVLNPEPLIEMSRQGRELVERHNDSAVVAKKFLEVWLQ